MLPLFAVRTGEVESWRRLINFIIQSSVIEVYVVPLSISLFFQAIFEASFVFLLAARFTVEMCVILDRYKDASIVSAFRDSCLYGPIPFA